MTIHRIVVPRAVDGATLYGVSDHTHSCRSIANARPVIGKAPQDDAEREFVDDIARFVTSLGRISA